MIPVFEKKCAKDTQYAAARGELLDAVAGVVAPVDEELACYVAIHASTVKARDTGKPILAMLERAVDEMLSTPRVSKTWDPPDGAPRS